MRQRAKAVRLGSLWYLAVPLLSVGLLTFLPFVHAAVRLRRLWLWLAAVGFALVCAGLIYVSGQPEGTVPGAVEAVFVIAALGSMVGGTAVSARLRHEVYGLGGQQPRDSSPAPTVDSAVQQVLEARAKRARARDLAAADPLMAHELGIGRPDVERTYDDGGLVDIASAPEPVIAEVCDLPAELAAAIVAVRDVAVTVDDLFSLTDLPVSTWDRIRDRAIIIR